MKELGVLLFTICLAGVVININAVYAVSFLKLEREFSGKGSTGGTFSANIHVAFDLEGNIYVSDTDNRLIQKLSSSGKFLMQIPEEPQAVDNVLKKPGDIAVDVAGNIYIAETTVHHIAQTADPKIYLFAPCVYKFNPEGELIHTYFVDQVDVKPNHALPASLIVDEQGKTAFGIQPRGHDRTLRISINSRNELYVLDAKRGRIHKFDGNGDKLHAFGRYGAGHGEFDRDASDIAIDTLDNVLIADTGNHRVVKFDIDGHFLLDFGVRGRNNGEFTKPIVITVLRTGEILVKDSSQFNRYLGRLPAGGTLGLISPNGTGLQDPILRSARRPRISITDQNNVDERWDFDILTERIRLLEEAEYRRYFGQYSDDENETEKDEDLEAANIRATIYHYVITRIQKFDSEGNYVGRVIYQVDKHNEKDKDTDFLTLDPFGQIYLRNERDLVIRQYSLEGFSLKRSHMDGLYNVRATNADNNFTEDYEDIDPDADVQENSNQLELSNTFLWNYSLSERWNLIFAGDLTYSELDNRYVTPPKAENSYALQTKSLTNTLAANLKFITDPNPYGYKELNIYLERVDVTSVLDQTALFPEINRQRQKSDCDASAISIGLNWDILSKANLWFEYADLNPAQTSRNFIRRYFDVSGDLYEVFGSRNEVRQITGELTVKF